MADGKKKRDMFQMIDGKQTDKNMHNIDDDEKLRNKINDYYRTTPKK